MNKLFVSGVVLACCLAACLSDQLCVPDQMQGEEIIFANLPDIRTKEHNKIFYDAATKAKAKVVYKLEGMEKLTLKYKLLVRYDDGDKSGKVYIVDVAKGNKCTVLPYPHPFEKICLPENAKAVDAYSVGPITGGLKVNGYLVEKDNRYVYMAAKRAGDVIYPTSAKFFYANDLFSTMYETRDYANIRANVTIPGIFDVPKECAAQEYELKMLEPEVHRHTNNGWF